MFLGAGADGTNCSATTDGYSGGNYNQLVGGGDWIGWVLPPNTSLAPTPSNAAPTVSITSPANGASFAAGSNVTISASASDSDGSIAEVRFFVEQKRVGRDASSPFSATTGALSPGTYRLKAVAVDNRKAVHASAVVTINVTGFPTIANAGFEAPTLPANSYQDAPAGATWAMDAVQPNGQSGISRNNSPFTAGSPNAPELMQVGLIQGEKTISQSVNFGTAGNYRLRFLAVQRAINQHTLDVEILLNGVPVGRGQPVRPYGAAYAAYTSDVFQIPSAGPYTITLRGVNPMGTDNTLFFDTVSVVAP